MVFIRNFIFLPQAYVDFLFIHYSGQFNFLLTNESYPIKQNLSIKKPFFPPKDSGTNEMHYLALFLISYINANR